MNIYTCGNPDCGKRSTQDELFDAGGECPYCGSIVMDFSHHYVPPSDDIDDDDEEPVLREW